MSAETEKKSKTWRHIKVIGDLLEVIYALQAEIKRLESEAEILRRMGEK